MAWSRPHIEKEARRLQYEIWTHRDLLFEFGVPPLPQLFSPEIAARVCDISYEFMDGIPSRDGSAGFDAAGTFDRGRNQILISHRFAPEVRRFTGAHEIGHYVLHPQLGFNVAHRDRPVGHHGGQSRAPMEREADYFAACFLAPAKVVIQEFEKRFGKPPLVLDENLAFHLAHKQARLLLTAGPQSLEFATALAAAQSLDGRHFPSMAQTFGISVQAMAIRIYELGLTSH